MIDHAHREQFRNKLSSVAFSAKSNDVLKLSDELAALVQAYNGADDPAAKMEELLEQFWQRPENERQALIDQMKTVEVQLQEQQQAAFASEEGFNLFDD